MILRVSSVLVALAFAAFIAGCSESPTAQYDASKTAIEEARLAGAEMYAPDLLKEAADSLNAATVEIQKQDGRFSVLRDYDKAEEIIVIAQQLAGRANQEAVAEKERVRLADSTLIVEIETLISETKGIIATAPRGKGSRVDLKVMQADLDGASGALTAATEEFQKGDYLSARNSLSAVKSQVVKVKSEIEAAVARLTKK